MAGDRVSPPQKQKRRARARTSRSKLARDFYASALDAAERRELDDAAEVEGLDAEIAVLRVKLRAALSEQKGDLAVMLRGIDLLVKAVSARYRLSDEAKDNLSDSIAGVVRGVGGLLTPEAFADE